MKEHLMNKVENIMAKREIAHNVQTPYQSKFLEGTSLMPLPDLAMSNIKNPVETNGRKGDISSFPTMF